MFRYGSFFLISMYSLMLKILGHFYKHVDRSKPSLAEEMGSDFSESSSQLDDEAESSVLLQSDLVCRNSKCQVFSGENLSGFLEEPKTATFMVHELFVASSSQTLGAEICHQFEQKSEENRDGFDQESDSSSFYFKLLNGSFSATIIEETRENSAEMENISEKEKPEFCDILVERTKVVEDDTGFDDEETRENSAEMENIIEKVKEEKPEFCDILVERTNVVEDDKGFAYVDDEETRENSADMENISEKVKEEKPEFCDIRAETTDVVEDDKVLACVDDGINNSSNWMSSFLDQTDQPKKDDLKSLNNSQAGDLDDEYIEFVPQENAPPSSSSCLEESRDEKPEQTTSLLQNHFDSDSDCDDDELDALSEHQHLVEQMKMELKNCRIGGLPTISEESETPKMKEDLRPLQIDDKIGYKDVMQGIQSFYKTYTDKMRKLDILNYQTSHAINFLQLKESRAYPTEKKKGDLLTFALPKIWPVKMRKIHADPMHKSTNEMQRDLELVYVGQACLSWEILVWMESKAQELQEYDGGGTHSYNRAVEEFQQFQVLLQRFMEDEAFQGRRDENYARSRCMLRSLLQVPMIRDDCVKMKKERREETDAITIEMLVEMIKESMVIFHEFVLGDKKAMDGGLLSKVDLQDCRFSELLLDVVSNLHKKERRIKEQMRSQNCIVKKLKKNVEGRWESEILRSQVELRLIWRVVNMSRLSEDRLVWCQKKLNNISFVGRKVHREASFMLFPC